jgi:hypothetical protein
VHEFLLTPRRHAPAIINLQPREDLRPGKAEAVGECTGNLESLIMPASARDPAGHAARYAAMRSFSLYAARRMHHPNVRSPRRPRCPKGCETRRPYEFLESERYRSLAVVHVRHAGRMDAVNNGLEAIGPPLSPFHRRPLLDKAWIDLQKFLAQAVIITVDRAEMRARRAQADSDVAGQTG